ncbi:MAG: hypothetical protein LBR29_05715 [Methylobacteriaceae bacterium]|nr:hypothetical protein [Methylobacteriaceae bacterium]
MACTASLVAADGAAAPPGCAGARQQAVLADVHDDGVLILEDGSMTNLRDIRLPDGDMGGNAVDLLRQFEGKPLLIASKTQENRWETSAVEAAPAEAPDGESLAARLVDRGLAVVDSREHAALCDLSLLQREARARARKLGLWSNPANQPLWSGRPAEILKRKGSFTLVQGQVISVGGGREWVFLNFGWKWNEDFTVRISKNQNHRVRPLPPEETLDYLKGKRVRVRGVIDEWGGPLMTLYSLDMLEIWGD